MDWNQLILRAIVPISFLTIWALTALFNKELKDAPGRPPTPQPPGGPRQGDPPLRWSTQGNPPPMSRRSPMGEDEILILGGGQPARPSQGSNLRRPARGRQAPQPLRKGDPVATPPKLGTVNQNVNQSIARTIELAPLSTIAPMPSSSNSLANAPSSPAKSTAIIETATIRPLMNDPARLREAFIVNELLQPPLALRGRRGRHS